MARIQFLFDKVMGHPNFISLLAAADQQAIDQLFAIGDKD
jgi:hypothetical protein